MNTEELRVILEKHQKWLSDEAGGERANLSNANLSNANLRYADLSNANLRYADLRYADLSGADLRYADLRYADLRYADLSDADLSGADLRYADLRYADLSDADLDYSCLPLWCGSLKAHFDERQITQILYHLLSAASYSKNVRTEIKELLLTPELCELANKFHRVDECGEIEALKKPARLRPQ